MDSIRDFYSGGNSNPPRLTKTKYKTCSVCTAWCSGDRCLNGCSPPQPAPELPPLPAAQIAAVLVHHKYHAAEVFAEAAAEFLGLPRGGQIFRGKRFDLIPFRLPPERRLADRTALGWKGLFLLAGDQIPPALAALVKDEQLPLLPDWLPEPFASVVWEQLGLAPARLSGENDFQRELREETERSRLRSEEEDPLVNTHAAAPTPPPKPKRLPRRKADRRLPHHYCRNLQSGLFRDRRIEGDASHIVLTHSCGKPSRCNPCANFDRDRRYNDFLYALEFESSTTQIYYFQTDDDKVWSNFRTHQRRTAKRRGEGMRRWESREDAPDGDTIYRVVTPIPHPDATPIGRGEADEIVRRECGDLHTRGARRTTVRCWGGWRQEKVQPKYERLCRSIPDTGEIEGFLKSISVDFEIKPSSRGTLYRSFALRYDSDEQRDAVRQFFVERGRVRRKSRSEVLPLDCDKRDWWRRYLERFDSVFEDSGRRRTG